MTRFWLVCLLLLGTAPAPLHAQTRLLFLPLVSSAPPTLNIRIGSGLDAAGALLGVATRFPATTRVLYYHITGSAAASQSFTERWLRDEREQPELTIRFTMPASGIRTSAIAANDGGALPPGSYRIEIRAGSQLAASAEATIGNP